MIRSRVSSSIRWSASDYANQTNHWSNPVLKPDRKVVGSTKIKVLAWLNGLSVWRSNPGSNPDPDENYSLKLTL